MNRSNPVHLEMNCFKRSHAARRSRIEASARSHPMDHLSVYADRPVAFIGRYIRLRPMAHGIVLISVLGAVGCSVCTQYGIKLLVDALSRGTEGGGAVWFAYAVVI